MAATKGITRRGVLGSILPAFGVAPAALEGLADAAQVVRAALARGLRPDPPLFIDEWADKYRWLDSRSAAAPGQFRTSKTPYMKAIMRALSPSSRAQIVVFRSPRQMGKTESGSNNLIGYTIHKNPAPIVLAMPGEKLLKRNKSTRIDPMLENVPELRYLVSPQRKRDGSNSVFELRYPGGMLVCLTYNSAADLRSTPFKIGIFDEVEGAPLSVEGEGSPLDILTEGAKTFGVQQKLYFTSTPKWTTNSLIDKLYEETLQHRFELPCPDCGERQELLFEQLSWPEGKPAEAVFACKFCGSAIEEHQKQWMFEEALSYPDMGWRAVSEDKWDGTRVGFSIEGLAAPLGWSSWADIAAKSEAAGADPAKLQAFWNTVIGRSFEPASEIMDWQRLYQRRENYDIGTVPAGGLVLTCACDVQADRIEGEVVAWGRGLESWSVKYFVLSGRTSEKPVWNLLRAELAKTYPSAYGVPMAVTLTAVDARYNTSHVYEFVRKAPPGSAIAIRGVEDSLVPIGQPQAVDVSAAGRRKRRGLQIWPISTGKFKAQIYGWLAMEPPTEESGEPYPAGYMHVPQYGEEWFRQLCAERLKTDKSGKQKWEKWRDRNEAIDCRSYNLGCAYKLQLDQFTERHWEAIEERLIPEENRPADQVERGAKRRGGVRSSHFREED